MVREEDYGQRSFAMLGVDEAAMWELELHTKGGLLACSTELDLCADDGICIVFHLSTGAAFRINARVRCLRPLPGTGKLAAWIEYTDLGAAGRREFLRWQANITCQTQSNRVTVEVERKYQVRHHGGALSVSISGQLEAGEARALCTAITSRVNAKTHGLRMLLLDLDGAELSSDESLRCTRRWLRHLQRARVAQGLQGLLVGKSSAGYVQLRRLVREVGLDERLHRFDTIDDAMPSWKRLLRQLPLRGRHSWREESLCA